MTDLLPDNGLKSHPDHRWQIGDIRKDERAARRPVVSARTQSPIRRRKIQNQDAGQDLSSDSRPENQALTCERIGPQQEARPHCPGHHMHDRNLVRHKHFHHASRAIFPISSTHLDAIPLSAPAAESSQNSNPCSFWIAAAQNSHRNRHRGVAYLTSSPTTNLE